MPKHIYCIANNSVSKNHLTDKMVCSIPNKDISAVIKDTSLAVYDSIPKDIINRRLSGHTAVIEELMKKYTVAPVKFETIAKDDAEIKDILRTNYSLFKNAL